MRQTKKNHKNGFIATKKRRKIKNKKIKENTQRRKNKCGLDVNHLAIQFKIHWISHSIVHSVVYSFPHVVMRLSTRQKTIENVCEPYCRTR